jgi:putative endonuclease
MIYTVYILFSEKHNKIYIGFSSHNTYGRDWTSKFRPWVVIYTECYSEKNQAMQREKKLKQGKGREWVWKKIHAEFRNKGFISA